MDDLASMMTSLGDGMSHSHANHSPLAAIEDATHIATGSGSWFDPNIWNTGTVPGDDARVVIPTGFDVTYDGQSNASLFTVGVMGGLSFATDQDTRMVVDTLVVQPKGKLTVGSAENPVADGIMADIVFANNGPIDVNWDPGLLSRGLLGLGDVEIHGAEKTSHHKAQTDPMSGDTTLDLAEVPVNWSVGDVIVIAGTRYDGHKWDNDIRAVRHFGTEDEVRVITAIEGGTITLDTALEHDHDTPRADLKTSIANYTRNVTFQSEDGAQAHERGHVMLHTRDSHVSYAAFDDLGRTDKSRPAMDASAFDVIEPDSNIQGRYSLHFHNNGVDDPENFSTVVGNSIMGSPGWGLVHHNSNLLVHNNATFNTFGAGFVAETGNEIGAWTDNIAINAPGLSDGNPKNLVDLPTFDMAKTGDGFWFQGRMVQAEGNIAASVGHGFTYFHRGARVQNADERGMINIVEGQFQLADALDGRQQITVDDVPILTFSNNETFASHHGLYVVKANPRQGHDIHSRMEDFTAWNVRVGAELEYTSHYVLNNFDLIGKEDVTFKSSLFGVIIGTNASDFSINDLKVEAFNEGGVELSQRWTGDRDEAELNQKQFLVINPEFIDIAEDDQIVIVDGAPSGDELVIGSFDPVHLEVEFDGPLRFQDNRSDQREQGVEIRGTKTDSLGTSPIPAGDDTYKISRLQVQHILETDGYYTTPNGERFFFLEQYFSDRLTGEIFKTSHLVEIDADINFNPNYGSYTDVIYRGELDLNNAAPITQSEQVTIEAGRDTIIDLTANDRDPDGDSLTIDGIVPPSNGQAFDNGDGTITYRPSRDYTGTETIKYWVKDGAGNLSEATLSVTVSSDAPDIEEPVSEPLTPEDDTPNGESDASDTESTDSIIEDEVETDSGTDPVLSGTGIADLSEFNNGDGISLSVLNHYGTTAKDLRISDPDITRDGAASGAIAFVKGRSDANVLLASDDVALGESDYDISNDHGVDTALTNGALLTGYDGYVGTALRDSFFGRSHDDVFSGLAGNDVFITSSGDDTITGGSGSDYIDGGDGTDIARFERSIAEYTFEQNGDITHVTHRLSGDVDRIKQVETLEFDDGRYAVTTGAVTQPGTTIPDEMPDPVETEDNTDFDDVAQPSMSIPLRGSIIDTENTGSQVETGGKIGVVVTAVSYANDLARELGWTRLETENAYVVNEIGAEAEFDGEIVKASARSTTHNRAPNSRDLLSDTALETALKLGSVVYNAQAITGTSFRDRFFGKNGDDHFIGGDGSDFFATGSGDDIVDAGNGNDSILLAQGNNFFEGGEGSDTLIIQAQDISAVFTYDSQSNAYTLTSSLGQTVLSNIEAVRLSDGTTADIETLVDPVDSTAIQLFVVAGQSNAGRIWSADSLEEVIEQNELDATVVYSLRGASSIAPKAEQLDWYPFEDGRDDTGELTRTLLNDIDTVLAESPETELAGILWVQGESDVRYADQYQTNLTGLHSLLVDRYGTDFNFTVSQLSENMAWYSGNARQLELSQAQADFVATTPGTTLLDPDEAIAQLGHTPQEAVSDAIHFNNLGADAIGYSFLTQFYDGLFTTYEKEGLDGTLVQETYVDTWDA